LNETFTVAVDPDIIDLAEIFLSNRRSQIQEWREAVAAGNTQLLHRLGHEIKGTAGSFGFHDLSKLGAQLEHTLAEGNIEGTEYTVKQMIDYLSRVEVVRLNARGLTRRPFSDSRPGDALNLETTVDRFDVQTTY
jgi:HPt (histidine-containing phosphotransfer) domain-containing protein